MVTWSNLLILFIFTTKTEVDLFYGRGTINTSLGLPGRKYKLGYIPIGIYVILILQLNKSFQTGCLKIIMSSFMLQSPKQRFLCLILLHYPKIVSMIGYFPELKVPSQLNLP